MDIRPLIRDSFEDMVADAFSAKEPTNMSTKPSLVIEFKGGVDSFSLKDNCLCTIRGLVKKMIKVLYSVWFSRIQAKVEIC